MAPTRPRVVIGGVAHLYQGDLDLGRVAIERLRHEDLGTDVAVEEFSYGAVAVAQRLEELRPELLLLVGAKARGREAGSVDRRVLQPLPRAPVEAQASIADAVTGYIDMDLVLEVAQALHALPRRVVTIEVEPANTDPSERLSPLAEAALGQVIQIVHQELATTFVPNPRG